MSQLSRKGSERRVSGISRRVTVVVCAAVAVTELAPAIRAEAQVPSAPAAAVSTAPRGSGLEGPLVLRLPASARLLGMANAGAAATDGDAIFYNPGMLTQARGVAVSVQRYGSRATSGSFGSVQTLGTFAVGIGAQVLQYGTPSGDPAAVLLDGAPRLADGGDTPASSSAFVMGLARSVGGIRVGASAKYAEERIGVHRDGTVSLDVGASKPLGRATLAVSVQNIGSGHDLSVVHGPLPTRFTVGYGGGLFPLSEQWDLGMQTQVSVERDGFVRPAGGVELGYVPIEGVAFVVRSGLRLPREKDEPLATAGLGITADRYSVDWAMEPMRGGRPVVHRLGLRIR